MIKITTLCLSFLVLITVPAKATNIQSLNPIESLSVTSSIFKEPIKYNVTLPQGYNDIENKDKRYFVNFDLHPRSQPYLSGMQDWLSHNGGWPWPQSIIITPASYNAEFASLFEQLVKSPSNHKILDYFEQDLLKAIENKYRTNGFKIYTGFVSNGAFGLYMLLNRPSLFNAYIVSSPSLANDFGAINSDANKKLAGLKEKSRFLYMATGNHFYEKSSIKGFEKFKESLKNHAPESLDWQVHKNNDNSYMSQPIISTIEGIEALFNDMFTDLAPDSEISQKGANAIVKHYKKLSTEKYGFEISAEGSLKALANSILESNADKALAIYHQTIDLYPESAYAYSALAQAYAKQNKSNKAITYQSKAVELAKTMSPWHQRKHQKMLEEYQN